MSAEVESEKDSMMLRCAACGVAQVDDIKLKKCAACGSVRYCGDKCQKDHRSKHKKACKKWAAELRDEILFKQPEGTHLGDCPICLLPLSLDNIKSIVTECCSKMICYGCHYANVIREMEQKIEHKCPFCRHPRPKSEEEADRNRMKRIEKNDPVALREVGATRYKEGDYRSAFEYWTNSAELGDVDAHFNLSIMYKKGEGVEKDEKKKVYHLEVAAIGGHPIARYNLGSAEWENGRLDRAVKHLIIAANLGHDQSLETLKKIYKAGLTSKEDFAAALRGHQSAVDATKSPQREVAEAAWQIWLAR
jgi:tetratricopeptide (TPR) repeat protein